MRESTPPTRPTYSEIAQTIAESLDTVAHERFHQSHGPGYAMPVGETTDLGLYPHSNRVKIDSRSLHLTLENVRAPQPLRDGVFLEVDEPDDQVKLLLDKTGNVVFSRLPDDIAPESEALTKSASGEVVNSPAEVGNKVVKRQVELFGTIGADPREIQTTKGTMVRFPLITTNEEGKRHWHEIVVFGALKSDVLDYIGKGMGLTVRGEPSTQWGNTRLTDMSLRPNQLTGYGA